MHLQILARDSSQSANTSFVIPFVVVIGIFFVLVISVIACRLVRVRHPQPRYIPTSYLKGLWKRWTPGQSKKTAFRDNSDHLEPISETSGAGRNAPLSGRQPPSSFDAATAHAVHVAEQGGAGVDRNTSVRSVMTLPAYNPKPGETEQVLGREGERGGIDTVVEFPEIAEAAEEERREEEMEALYQVRLARRAELAEREERRRLRREARERDDWVALEELRSRSRAVSGASQSHLDILREEHDRVKHKQRTVSSVSYGDLGVARHDGTRIRANSEESERPLLGDAASIAASSRHRRERSVSSVFSIDTMNSELPSPGFTTERTHSRGESPLRRASVQGQMSSPEMIENEQDLDEDVPLHSPPDYEHIVLETGRDAPPDYQSPVEASGQDLPHAESRQERDAVAGPDVDPIRAERPSGRAVGGVPRLPSLRLSDLPSIVVQTASPIAGRAEHGR